MAQLRRDLTRFVEDTGDKTIPAILGAKFDNVWQLPIPGQRGVVWVTTGGTAGFAGNKGAATGYTGGLPGMPIRIKIRNGLGEIVGPDHDQLPTYTGGGTTLPGAVGPHTHAIGSGMVDPVEGLRFLPLSLYALSVGGSYGLSVGVRPGSYKHAGKLRWFGGGVIDLTSYLPGTANKKAWVIIGINPTTNTLTAQTGTEYALAVTMTPSLMDQTSFAGLIPIGAVVLENGQTSINNIAKFADLRDYTSGAAVGRGEIMLSASGMWPSTTGGCATNTKNEYTTNDQDLYSLDFDASTDEYAQASVWMPDDWDGGTLTAKFAWSAASSSGDVIWGLQGRAYANDDAIDASWGTAQTVTDTLTATGDMHYTAETSAITLAGAPAAGQFVQFRVYRDANAGGDTLAADAQLLAIKVYYNRG